MADHNPTYELKALVLAPSDALGRIWAEGREFNAKEVRVGTEAKRFKGYPRDLPVYIVHSGPATSEYRAEIDAIRLHFRVTREVFV